MKIFELKQKIINILQRDITNTEIGEALNLGRSAMSYRFKNNIEITESEIEQISNYFKFDKNLILKEKTPEEIIDEELAEIPKKELNEMLELIKKTTEDPSQENLDKLRHLATGLKLGQKIKN